MLAGEDTRMAEEGSHSLAEEDKGPVRHRADRKEQEHHRGQVVEGPGHMVQEEVVPDRKDLEVVDLVRREQEEEEDD